MCPPAQRCVGAGAAGGPPGGTGSASFRKSARLVLQNDCGARSHNARPHKPQSFRKTALLQKDAPPNAARRPARRTPRLPSIDRPTPGEPGGIARRCQAHPRGVVLGGPGGRAAGRPVRAPPCARPARRSRRAIARPRILCKKVCGLALINRRSIVARFVSFGVGGAAACFGGSGRRCVRGGRARGLCPGRGLRFAGAPPRALLARVAHRAIWAACGKKGGGVCVRPRWCPSGVPLVFRWCVTCPPPRPRCRSLVPGKTLRLVSGWCSPGLRLVFLW